MVGSWVEMGMEWGKDGTEMCRARGLGLWFWSARGGDWDGKAEYLLFDLS